MAGSDRLKSRLAVVGFTVLAGLLLCDRVGQVVADMRIRHALGAIPGLGVGSFDLDADRQVAVFRNLKASTQDGDITVGRLELPLALGGKIGIPGSASAAAPAAAALDDVRLVIDKTQIVIPHLSATASSLSAAELRKIFNPALSDSLEDRLAKVSASEMTAPEIKVFPPAQKDKPKPVAVVFHNVMLANVVAGRIGSLAVDQVSITDIEKNGSMTTGAIAASHLDLPLLLKIAKGSRTDAALPIQPVIAGFSIYAVDVKSPDFKVKIGSLRSTAIKSRPPLTAFSELAVLTDKPSAERSPAEEHRIARATLDMFENFALDHFEMRDIAFLNTGADSSAVQFTAFTIDDLEPGKLRTMSMEGFATHSAKVDVTCDRFALEGYDQSALLKAIRQSDLPLDSEKLQSQFSQAMPTLGTLSVQGVKVDTAVDDLKGNAGKGTRTVVEMPVAEIKMSRDTDGTSHTSTHLRMIYDIAPDSVDPTMLSAVQEGFSHFDMSLDSALRWNAASRKAALDRLSISGENLASVSVGMTLGHLAPELFDTAHQDAAANAAQDIEVETVNLDVKDGGLAARLWVAAAARAGVSVPLLKAEAKGQVQAATLKAFGNTPTATKISNALSAFIDEPKTLALSVKAPAGLNVRSIAQSGGGRELLDLLQIEAAADQ